MGDLDLTEAVARVLAQLEDGEDWPTNAALGGNLTGTRDDEFRYACRDEARNVLAVATPLIAAQVRAQIAADIDEAARRPVLTTVFDATSILYGFRAAARIARGDS